MKLAHTNFRSVLALLLLCAVAAVCVCLGMWQLQRAAERDALHHAIERGRLQAPLSLSANTRPADLQPWRPAVAEGVWSPQHTVLLENRNLDGRPGYWVATPLILQGTEPKTAVLVLRGWLPRKLGSPTATPSIPLEHGLIEIHGELHSHVPRIFELWSWAGGKASDLPAAIPARNGAHPVVQNLELSEYARATGLRLLPAVLAQTNDSVLMAQPNSGSATSKTIGGVPGSTLESNAALTREWPGPSVDSDQNRGYALQWFSFAAIAAVAAAVIAHKIWRIAAGGAGDRRKDAS